MLRTLSLYVSGIFFLTSIANAAVVTQPALSSQKVSAPLVGTTNKSFSFNASVNAGTFVMQVGDGKNIVIEKCQGNVLQKLACALENAAKTLVITLTRPTNVDIKLNGTSIVSKSNYDPSKGQCARHYSILK